MLSIGKLTVEQARYYERQVAQGRDDYYSGRGESPGRWTGRGGEALGLVGVVDEEGFIALIEGRHPGTGEPLRRVGGRSKVAAFDLTVSAPKSVSVLFAVGDGVLARAMVEAHESAVEAALGYVEREACRVRRGRTADARQQPTDRPRCTQSLPSPSNAAGPSLAHNRDVSPKKNGHTPVAGAPGAEHAVRGRRPNARERISVRVRAHDVAGNVSRVAPTHARVMTRRGRTRAWPHAIGPYPGSCGG